MRLMGYFFIILAIPACLITVGMNWTFSGSNEFSSAANLPCLVTIGLFLGGVALLKFSDYLVRRQQEIENQKIEERQAEINRKEEELIKKWVESQPKQKP